MQPTLWCTPIDAVTVATQGCVFLRIPSREWGEGAGGGCWNSSIKSQCRIFLTALRCYGLWGIFIGPERSVFRNKSSWKGFNTFVILYDFRRKVVEEFFKSVQKLVLKCSAWEFLKSVQKLRRYDKVFWLSQLLSKKWKVGISAL